MCKWVGHAPGTKKKKSGGLQDRIRIPRTGLPGVRLPIPLNINSQRDFLGRGWDMRRYAAHYKSNVFRTLLL